LLSTNCASPVKPIVDTIMPKIVPAIKCIML
jgi:hypothetical protein